MHPNSSSSLGWPAVSRLMGGYSCHFSLHYIYRSGSPPKKNPTPSVSLPRPATGTFQVHLFHLHHHRTGSSPPHLSVGLPGAPRNHTLLHRRYRQPHRTITTFKPYTHPPLLRSRLSCGVVHPTGAALPTPSSSAPDVARQLSCSPHLNLFIGAAVHDPDLLHRRRRARVYESYNEAHPSLLLSHFYCCLQVLA